MELVSACLAGVACRYNGACRTDRALAARAASGDLLPVCPELLGGLSLPRPPSEIRGGAGAEVLDGKARVVSRDGADLTAAFLKGAQAVLDLARSVAARDAFLAARSPSCGVGEVHDGGFSGGLIPGDGVAAALLARNGIHLVAVGKPKTAATGLFAPTQPGLRLARKSDAADLARLAAQLGYPSEAEALAPRLAMYSADQGKAIIVAEEDGRVVGWASLELVELLISERHVEISALVVDEERRNRGIGGRILAEAQAWAESRGARLLRVRSNVVRQGAHRFYEAQGFARTKESYTFEKPVGRGESQR